MCRCSGKHHIPVPKDFCQKIGPDGNPRQGVTFEWETTCPLAALELIWQHQEGYVGQQPRCYGKWLGSGSMGTSDRGNVAAFAVAWLRVQGATDDTYDTNAGRKSLARWTRKLLITYRESVPIHGDLQGTWRTSYDERLPKSDFEDRKQPRDPDLACAALRKMARYIGAGRKLKAILTKRERFQSVFFFLGCSLNNFQIV